VSWRDAGGLRRDGRLDIDIRGRVWEWDHIAKEEDVVEGALVHHVEACLVALEEGKRGGIGEVSEGAGNARAMIGAGLSGDAVGEEFGLHAPSAAQAPVGGDHFLDHGLLDGIEWGETFEVLIEGCLEALGIFTGEDDGLGEETVTDGVLGGTLFPFRSNRAAGKTSVGA
jgi:hypothetical protein